MIDTGADPYSVMRRLGHTSVQVTFDRYGHRFPERDAVITPGLEDAYRRATEATATIHPIGATAT
jgi:integrase